MTPHSIHFLVQMIRHQRAMVSSFEKWVCKQPRSETCRELIQMIAVWRAHLTEQEQRLSQFVVETEPSATGSEEMQPSREVSGSPAYPFVLSAKP